MFFFFTGNCLYAWLIVPSKGVVKFHESSLSEEPEEAQGTLLERLVQSVRDSLGVSDDVWGSTPADDLTSEKAGFLRMVS